MAQQGSGPPRFTPAPVPGARDQRRSSADPEDTGDDLPAWVVPEEVRRPRRHKSSPRRDRAERRARRLLPGRARANRARRARRRLHVWGGVAGGAAVVAAGIYFLVSGGSGAAPAGANGFVTTYQPGEYRSVPGMCSVVSPATLAAYLPGKPTRAFLPGLSGNSGNQCDWTLDHKSAYRLLQVTAQAYAPSGLASGNGSATSAAQDGYAQARQTKLDPPKATRQPPARLTTIPALGTAAFSAYQVIKAGGDTTDRVTLVVRIRNVLVTVQFSGLDHASRGSYGPVSPGQLKAGAVAVARNVLAKFG